MVRDYKFSIITPTLLRPSLEKTIESVNQQGYEHIEHIIAVDKNGVSLNDSKSRQKYIYVDRPNRINDYGNTARKVAYEHITGDYIVNLDDDDYYIRNDLFSVLNKFINENGEPDIVLFPSKRLGQLFYSIPPQECRVVSCQYAYKKVIGGVPSKWSFSTDYLSDWHFLKSLMMRAKKFTWVKDLDPFVEVIYINKGLPHES